VTTEVAAFMPFLLSDDEPQEVGGTTEAVRARLFVKGGERRLLAVNTTLVTQKVKLSTSRGDVVSVSLAPLEVQFINLAND